MSDCPSVERLGALANLLVDSDEERAALNAHVSSCEACRGKTERLTRLLAFPAESEPPAHVLPALMAKVAEKLTQDAEVGKETPVSNDEEPVPMLGGQVDAPRSATDLLPAATAPPPLEAATPEAPPVTTLSQQAAEDIIKRITTKAPEEGAKAPAPPAEPLKLTPRPSSWNVGRVAVVLIALFAVAGYAVTHREDLAPYLGGTTSTSLPENLEQKYRAKVLESECLAFGYASVADWQKSQQGHGGGK